MLKMVFDSKVRAVNVHIHEHVIVTLSSMIGHGPTIRTFAILSLGVTISGKVTIEEGAFTGTGASIRDGMRIGSCPGR